MRNTEKASAISIGFCFSSKCSVAYMDALKSVPISAFYKAYRPILHAIMDSPSFDGGFSDISAIVAKIQSIGMTCAVADIAECAGTIATEQSALQCVEILLEIYHQNRLTRSLIKMSTQCSQIKTSEELKKWIESTQKSITEKLSIFAKSDFTEMADSVSEAISDLSDTDQSVVLTGFRDIDRLIGGFKKKSLVLIAGRPSMGKTSWVVCQALRSAYRNHKGLIFSLEMSRSQIGQKMISIATKTSTDALSSQINVAMDAARQISHLPIEVSAESHRTVEDICSIVRQKSKVDFVVIDYLQLMKATPGFQSREREVAHISMELKSLAKSVDTCVIAVCQLNRALESRKNKKPTMADLRESGSLEQDADLVGFLYRESVYDREADPTLAEFVVAKNRLGPTGSERIKWDSSCTRFSDY